MNDGPVNEFCERVMCVLIRVPLSVRRLVVIQLLNSGVKPPGGHTGFRKQRERTQLASSHLLRAVLHTVDGGFDGHPQYHGHVVRILISRNRANDKFLAAGIQSLEIPCQRQVFVTCGRSSLGNSDGQVAEVLGQRIRGLTIIGVGDREEVFDRRVAIEHPDLDAIPPLVFPTHLVCCRCDHAHAVAARNESRQVIDVFHVVEDDEPVGGANRLQMVEATADDLVLSGQVARVNLESLGEFDQVALD